MHLPSGGLGSSQAQDVVWELSALLVDDQLGSLRDEVGGLLVLDLLAGAGRVRPSLEEERLHRLAGLLQLPTSDSSLASIASIDINLTGLADDLPVARLVRHNHR